MCMKAVITGIAPTDGVDGVQLRKMSHVRENLRILNIHTVLRVDREHVTLSGMASICGMPLRAFTEALASRVTCGRPPVEQQPTHGEESGMSKEKEDEGGKTATAVDNQRIKKKGGTPQGQGKDGDQDEIKSSMHKKHPATYLLSSSTLACRGVGREGGKWRNLGVLGERAHGEKSQFGKQRWNHNLWSPFCPCRPVIPTPIKAKEREATGKSNKSRLRGDALGFSNK
ncbi:Hypothetical predicted protein [Xyrichtys novacula]|uniref:Uncharacterized protein n=1 Tax=Xyrichtys novacula TaxID=13765 RepID=A0AAV1F0X9_XYRNO|nr:Hypothetical predicted protein [Xyrichtys novacula]